MIKLLIGWNIKRISWFEFIPIDWAIEKPFQQTVSPTIFIVSWKVLIDCDRLSMISSWLSNLSSISCSRRSRRRMNSAIASRWNSSIYLCYFLSWLLVVSLKAPSFRDLSVRSLSIFFCKLYLLLSTSYMMSFSRSILVWTSPSNWFWRPKHVKQQS